MLGGLKITDATRRHAAEMLQNARAAGTPVVRQGRSTDAGRGKTGLVLGGRRCARRLPGGRAAGTQGDVARPEGEPVPDHRGDVGGRGERRRARGQRRRFRRRRRQAARGLAPFRAAPRLPRGFSRRQSPTACAGSPASSSARSSGTSASRCSTTARWKACSRASSTSGASTRNIASGVLDAVAITCSGYTSGQSCSFFQGAERFEGWQRSQRIGIKTRITVAAPHGVLRRSRSCSPPYT